MTIDDESELWALISALLELKFGQSACSDEVAGSAPLARVLHRLWEEFQATRLFENVFPGNSWMSWQQITPERKEWSRIVGWIRGAPAWSSWSADEKRLYVRSLALPCVIHPDYMDQIAGTTRE